MRKVLWLAVIAIVAGGTWYYVHGPADKAQGDKAAASGASSGGSKRGGSSKGPVPVGLATAQTGNITVYLDGLGTITPRSTVTVHSLVTGELQKLHFEEGQLVKQGELLASIDDRPYQAVLKQAEGLLARDQALLADSKINLSRYQELWKQDSIARQQLDSQASLVKQYEGAAHNDQGQVDAARVNLAYTRIVAPVSGRVGLRQVDAGNIVHATDTNGIVIVTELQPITAIFTLAEDSIPEVLKHTVAGRKTGGGSMGSRKQEYAGDGYAAGSRQSGRPGYRHGQASCGI